MIYPEIGFYDRGGRPLRLGDRVVTRDKSGKKWYGVIVEVDPACIVKSAMGGIQYGFQSRNSLT